MTIENIKNSNHPVQVMFYDGEDMSAGIMVGDKIICSCCGALFDVDEVVENAREDGVEAICMFEYWVDVSDEIRGGNDWEDWVTVLETED